MPVLAILRDGSQVEVAPEFGATITEIVANLTRGSLTGSAVALADAKLRSTDGREFPYADVNALSDEFPV